MNVTVVVLYRKALAHYTVTVKEDGSFEAGLLKYGGHSCDAPPQQIRFRKEGRHCTGSSEDEGLMDELCYAVQLELEKAGSSTRLLSVSVHLCLYIIIVSSA